MLRNKNNLSLPDLQAPIRIKKTNDFNLKTLRQERWNNDKSVYKTGSIENVRRIYIQDYLFTLFLYTFIIVF